jgi:hypothetical protein
MSRPIISMLLWVSILGCAPGALSSPTPGNSSYGEDGPLGEWPDFNPIGFITAPHPDNPQVQTFLYGDWGAIVGEEFMFLQGDKIKLLYHSYHETYLTQRLHELDLLPDWALGYDPITKIKLTPLVQPGGPYPGPAWAHTDTPGYLEHPITGQHLLYNTVRPGTAYLHPEWAGLPGSESAIQVATSETAPAMGVPFTQTYQNMLVADLWWEQGWNHNGVIKGGLSEPTPVWVPHLGPKGAVRLFYRGLHGSTGSYWNWRISYADSDNGVTDWVKHEIPTFDPSDPENPAYRWTQPPPEGNSFRGSWQAHCTGDVRADGVHMVLSVSNQNYAGGGRIAYYWSPDWGDTWFGHPDNPILVPGEHPLGVPAAGFQRTPSIIVDEAFNRYILAYNSGHDTDTQWRRWTHLAVADRPEDTTSHVEEANREQAMFAIEHIEAAPDVRDVSLDFMLFESGHLQVSVVSLDGRRVATLLEDHVPAGRRMLTWNKKSALGAPVPAGVYFLYATLSTPGKATWALTDRIVIAR